MPGHERHEPEDQRRARRIEELVQQLATLPDPHVHAQAEELIQTVLELYGDGLARILELIAASGLSGDDLIVSLGDDPLVGALLVLHGLHPLPIEQRVERAVEALRPALADQGGELTVQSVAEGVAYLRLAPSTLGSAQGRGRARVAASTAALTQQIEETLASAVPDLESIQVQGSVEQPQLITITPPRHRASASATLGGLRPSASADWARSSGETLDARPPVAGQ